LTEKDLILKCLKGDRVAQKELFERLAPRMMAVCQRYSRHKLEAEDMLQDGFVKVFTNLDKFNFNGSFEGWVRRIMVNTSLKSIAKKSFQNESLGIEEGQQNIHLVQPEILAKLSAEEIEDLINQLPEGYKLVFSLYAIEGYSHKEISEMLNIEESTSRSQLVKARRMLQKKILDLKKIAV